MAFHDVLFPPQISYGTRGSVEFSSHVVETPGGSRFVNSNWQKARAAFDVAANLQSQSELDAIRSFFYQRMGKVHSFRFKDWSNFKLANAIQGVAVNILTEGAFQIYQWHVSGAYSYARKITKPVNGTLAVRVDDALQVEGESNDYTANYSTGIVTFNAGKVPANGAVISVDCEFDLHVQFDTDTIEWDFSFYQYYGFQGIRVVEVKE